MTASGELQDSPVSHIFPRLLLTVLMSTLLAVSVYLYLVPNVIIVSLLKVAVRRI